jgi:hypothetical protein
MRLWGIDFVGMTMWSNKKLGENWTAVSLYGGEFGVLA